MDRCLQRRIELLEIHVIVHHLPILWPQRTDHSLLLARMAANRSSPANFSKAHRLNSGVFFGCKRAATGTSPLLTAVAKQRGVIRRMRSASEPLHKIADSGFPIQFDFRQPRTPLMSCLRTIAPLPKGSSRSQAARRPTIFWRASTRSVSGDTCHAVQGDSTRWGLLQPELRQ